MKEFTREARSKYDETQGLAVDKLIKRKTSKNANADPEKAKHKGGDL